MVLDNIRSGNTENVSGYVKCLLCGAEARLAIKNLHGYTEQQEFDIFHCNECDTSFSLPQPENTDEIYDLIYRNIKGIPNYYRYVHYADQVLSQEDPLKYLSENEQAYWGISKVLSEKTRKDKIRLLEIGCGLGYLTYSLNKAGYVTRGIDISENAITSARLKFGDFYYHSTLEEFANKHDIRYDVIILTEVIEHLKDVNTFVRDAAALLTEKGFIILTTPDRNQFSKFSEWYTELPPVHCWWFSERSISFLAGSLDLKAEFVDFREYYHEKPLMISVKELSEDKPVFDKIGMLKSSISEHKPNDIPTEIKKRNLLLKRIIGERLYNFIKGIYYKNHPDYVSFGRRGFSICAVLSRN